MSGLAMLTRCILHVLTVLSFIPQLCRLHDRASGVGVSITYAIINLIVATEQLAFGLQLITIDPQLAYEGITHSPLTAGDWLNVLQLLTLWLGHTIIFFDIVRLGPARPEAKLAAITVYTLFLLISLVPYLVEFTLPPETPDSDVFNDRSWFTVIFRGVHSYLVTPPVTALALLAFIPQAREITKRSASDSLSLTGLAIQAMVFSLVGISWMFRLTVPNEEWDIDLWSALYAWHGLVGWAAVYNLIFAFVQAALFGVARYRGLASEDKEETRPLLS